MNLKRYIGTSVNRKTPRESNSLSHTLLVAMPSLQDDLFSRSVVYVCAHSSSGATGLIVNQKLPDVQFKDLLKELKIPESRILFDQSVYCGGPVDTGQGFVLHSDDFVQQETMRLDGHLCLTGTIDILEAVAGGYGPKKSLFAVGYAGWGPGQLEDEILQNTWLTLPVDPALLFETAADRRWEEALKRLGATPWALSSEAGHA